MIEEIGTVVAVDGKTAWVETQVKSTCGSCKANDSCPSSTVAKAFSSKAEVIELEVPCELAIGQQVKLGIAEQALLHASLMVYILPLCLLMIVATVGQLLLPSVHELWLLLLGSIAALSGFWWVSAQAKKSCNKRKFAPVFLGATQQAVLSQKHEIPTHKID